MRADLVPDRLRGEISCGRCGGQHLPDFYELLQGDLLRVSFSCLSSGKGGRPVSTFRDFQGLGLDFNRALRERNHAHRRREAERERADRGRAVPRWRNMEPKKVGTSGEFWRGTLEGTLTALVSVGEKSTPLPLLRLPRLSRPLFRSEREFLDSPAARFSRRPTVFASLFPLDSYSQLGILAERDDFCPSDRFPGSTRDWVRKTVDEAKTWCEETAPALHRRHSSSLWGETLPPTVTWEFLMQRNALREKNQEKNQEKNRERRK